MPIDFPNTPTSGDTYSVGTRTWAWDGSTWNLVSQVSFIDGMIVNGDISASAAIALSKLASGTSGQIIVANASGVPTWTSESGDVTISDTGATAISAGVVVNADINSSAAIALSKLASGTSGQIIVVDGSGVPTYVALSGDATISNAGVITNAWDQEGNVLVNQVFS
jgi:hypothetical protein